MQAIIIYRTDDLSWKRIILCRDGMGGNAFDTFVQSSPLELQGFLYYSGEHTVIDYSKDRISSYMMFKYLEQMHARETMATIKSQDYQTKIDNFIASYGWTRQELEDEVVKEMEKNNGI